MNQRHYIAVDLGAESGRVMLGTFESGKLRLEEVHRFPNGPIRFHGTQRWDVLRLWEDMKAGLRKVTERGLAISSISVDSWGVDYVLCARVNRCCGCHSAIATRGHTSLTRQPAHSSATKSTGRPACS